MANPANHTSGPARHRMPPQDGEKNLARHIDECTGLSQIPHRAMLQQVSMAPSDERVTGIRIVRRPTQPHGEQFGQYSDLSDCSWQGPEARPLAACPDEGRLAASRYCAYRLRQDRGCHSRVGSTPIAITEHDAAPPGVVPPDADLGRANGGSRQMLVCTVDGRDERRSQPPGIRRRSCPHGRHGGG